MFDDGKEGVRMRLTFDAPTTDPASNGNNGTPIDRFLSIPPTHSHTTSIDRMGRRHRSNGWGVLACRTLHAAHAPLPLGFGFFVRASSLAPGPEQEDKKPRDTTTSQQVKHLDLDRGPYLFRICTDSTRAHPSHTQTYTDRGHNYQTVAGESISLIEQGTFGRLPG